MIKQWNTSTHDTFYLRKVRTKQRKGEQKNARSKYEIDTRKFISGVIRWGPSIEGNKYT